MSVDVVALLSPRLSTSDFCGAHPGVMALNPEIASLCAGAKAIGPARTARLSPGENGAIHRVIHAAGTGDFIVVSAGGERAPGRFGSLLALSCRHRGVAGLVIDGAVRDVAELRATGFPVFALCRSPMQAAKVARDQIDCEVECGGVVIRPGDIIVGDDDGVVAMFPGIAMSVAENVGILRARELLARERVRCGESTCEIFGIDT